MRIGLISDTHIPGSVRDLWPQVFDVFDGVDGILHAGDLHSRSVIDQLSVLAPVYVARGNGDIEVVHERLRDTWVLDFEGVCVCMIHEFPRPKRRSSEFIRGYLERNFPGVSPDVVVYGHTHRDEITHVDGMICINPGSPTLPRNQSTRLGTIGFLDIDQGVASASLFQLTEAGVEPHFDF